MSLIFADSFDHYTDLLTKYDAAGSNAIRTAGQSRTGIGCVEIIAGAFGPCKVIRQCQDVLLACAWFSSASGTPILMLSLGNEGANSQQGSVVTLTCELDRSISVRAGEANGAFRLIGQTVPGLVNLNVYNSIAVEGTCSISAHVKVWCNGFLVLSLVNVDTRNMHNPSRTYIDSIALWGPAGNASTCFIDDVYALDCTDAVNNSYLGPLRIYASAPTSDGAVVWVPSPAGANFANVNEIPPDGNTTYNSSGTIGQSDQYVHPLNGAVPANSQLFAVQHCMDVEVDTGSQAVTSDIGGVLNPDTVVLSSGYVIDTWPYDENPNTAAPWLASAFPLLAGPSVTA